MKIGFEYWQDFRGWKKAPDYLKSMLSEHGCRSILEVGSGANPTLAPDYVRDHAARYVTSDLSESELAKADDVFERLVLDLSSKTIDAALLNKFDCVFSRMVNEHVQDGEQYHKNIFRVLQPGGIAVHCFSTLGTLPFAINRMLPDFVTDHLLRAFSPRDEHKHGKFKAYYSWGRGPSKAMIARFESLGYEVLEYTGYYGHEYYRNRLPWLDRIEQSKAKYLLQHPVPQLCSYATLVLRKPVDVSRDPRSSEIRGGFGTVEEYATTDSYRNAS
jgi:SAM-dependent methyltransferase